MGDLVYTEVMRHGFHKTLESVSARIHTIHDRTRAIFVFGNRYSPDQLMPSTAPPRNYLVIEIADGILQRETAMLLHHPEVRKRLHRLVLCGRDAAGIAGELRILSISYPMRCPASAQVLRWPCAKSAPLLTFPQGHLQHDSVRIVSPQRKKGMPSRDRTPHHRGVLPPHPVSC